MLSSLNMPACDGNYCLRYLLWCVFAGSLLEVKIESDSNDAVEIKTEADSNDITEHHPDYTLDTGVCGLHYAIN